MRGKRKALLIVVLLALLAVVALIVFKTSEYAAGSAYYASLRG